MPPSSAVGASFAVTDFHTVLDLLGTFFFALSGAANAVLRKLDIFGVLVVAFVSANFGGILSDLLVGVTPPSAINDWRYVAVCMAGGVISFYWFGLVEKMQSPVLIFDAIGLGLFSVEGTHQALHHELSPVAAVIVGILTGIGGGIARDVLLRQVPAVFQGEVYAVASLAAALVVVLGSALHLPSQALSVLGTALCFGLRYFAMTRGWAMAPSRHAPQEEKSEL